MSQLEVAPVSQGQVAAAVQLVLEAYDEERQVLPFLPHQQDFAASLHERIAGLFTHGLGIAATEGGTLLGFLVGWEVEELFGSCKGIYSLLYGHGAVREKRRQLYQVLYQQAAELWVERACLTHALTLFAHDSDTLDTWFWQGFGLRCVDAMREAKPLQESKTGLVVTKASLADVPGLAELHRQHHLYYRESPVFMPRQEEDPVKDLSEWLEQANRHLWVAYREGRPVGYMRIQENGESFISEHPTIMNITGAYVFEEARGAGVGQVLLAAIQHWLLENDYPLCGVDYESINTLASRFWARHFIPYTYSLVRRIDERILDA